MWMRDSSTPVTAVRNTTSFGYSGGRPALRTSAAAPSRRNCSIVRAATWLHLTFGGSPRARVSSMTTLRPRAARSIASVRPTGPAPRMRTSASTVLMVCVGCVARATSIELRTRALDDVGPLHGLARDEAAELGRRRRAQLGAGGARAGDDLGIGEDGAHLVQQTGDDRLRGRRGRDD